MTTLSHITSQNNAQDVPNMEMLHQKRLPFRNLPPSRRKPSTLPPIAQQARTWIANRYRQADKTTLDAKTRRLLRLVQQVRYDDALIFGPWRLELLYLCAGYPHFRLYWCEFVFGLIDIRCFNGALIADTPQFPLIQRHLAIWLAVCCWEPEDVRLEEGGAQTELEATTDDYYRLFGLDDITQRRTAK